MPCPGCASGPTPTTPCSPTSATRANAGVSPHRSCRLRPPADRQPAGRGHPCAGRTRQLPAQDHLQGAAPGQPLPLAHRRDRRRRSRSPPSPARPDDMITDQAEPLLGMAQCHAAGLQLVLARHGHVGPALLPSRPKLGKPDPRQLCRTSGRGPRARGGPSRRCRGTRARRRALGCYRGRTTGSAARRPTGICRRASTSSPSPRRSSPCRPAPLARERREGRPRAAWGGPCGIGRYSPKRGGSDTSCVGSPR
jgi:hypothetical protein